VYGAATDSRANKDEEEEDEDEESKTGEVQGVNHQLSINKCGKCVYINSTMFCDQCGCMSYERVFDTCKYWPESEFHKFNILQVALLYQDNGFQRFLQLKLETMKKKEDNRLKLPLELIIMILRLSYGKNEQIPLHYLRLNKILYHILLPELYHRPKLTSPNFMSFMESIFDSNKKKKNYDYVRELDLSTIIQSGKNSFISKLLRRCSKNLTTFIAPQSKFGFSPLISLRQCSQLRILDLRLVSETMNLEELFTSLQRLPVLEQLSFPRSSVSFEPTKHIWPKKLWYLRLSGGISDEFLMRSNLPKSVTYLEFSHCPSIHADGIYHVLDKVGANLTHLYIHYPMPGLRTNSMDMIFQYCPNLQFLYIHIDYITREVFDEELLPALEAPRPLKTLWLDSSGMLGQSFKIYPDDLTIALSEGRLPCLKTLRISRKLGWNFNNDDCQDLVNELQDQDGDVYAV